MPRDIEILDMISKDMEADAVSLDGKPFDGKTVAEMFGKQCAAIQALAEVTKRRIIDADHVQPLPDKSKGELHD
jgi:hypothetical protein